MSSPDVHWWTGGGWIIVMFLSDVWTLILTAPIHCRGSTAEQVTQCYISPNLMKKQTHLHLGWSEGEHIFSKCSFLALFSKCSLFCHILAVLAPVRSDVTVILCLCSCHLLQQGPISSSVSGVRMTRRKEATITLKTNEKTWWESDWKRVSASIFGILENKECTYDRRMIYCIFKQQLIVSLTEHSLKSRHVSILLLTYLFLRLIARNIPWAHSRCFFHGQCVAHFNF